MQFGRKLKLTVLGVLTAALGLASTAALAQGGATVLKPADVQKMLPSSVFYRAQMATTQARNSGGIKFADGYYVLATMVDTSGYSTGIVAKYQAYFITETAIKIGGKALPAGVYGIGFVADGRFLVTDVGAHDVLSVPAINDAGFKRPMPLQILADGAGFRLYAGRKYVVITR